MRKPSVIALGRETTEKLPYVGNVPEDARTVYLLPYQLDDGSFRLPFPQAGDLEFLVVEPHDDIYIARDVAAEGHDLEIRLLTTIVRHLSFPHLLEPYKKIEDDLINLAASIEKYFILCRYASDYPDGAWRSVFTTEFEYLLVNLRAVYDQLVFFLRRLWDLVIQDGKQELPRSFERFAQKSPDDLRRDYNLPDGIVNFVQRASPVFSVIREVRVAIEHHGHTPRRFFRFADGIGVPTSTFPWDRFNCWEPSDLRTNDIGPYLKLLAWLGRETMVVVELLDAALKRDVPLPPPVTDWVVYLRSPAVRHFNRLQAYLAEPWQCPDTAPDFLQPSLGAR